jgi:energy-converting hydrogenase Eha subunit C
MVDRDNVGVVDTAVRALLACFFLAVAVEQVLPDSVSVILLVLGSALWLTSATGTCYLYKLLGIDTYHAK